MHQLCIVNYRDEKLKQQRPAVKKKIIKSVITSYNKTNNYASYQKPCNNTNILITTRCCDFFTKKNRHKLLLKVTDESRTESMQFHKISYSTLFFSKI